MEAGVLSPRKPDFRDAVRVAG
ncbi:hypothetical protein LINPERPRIM_LOCUS28649 [Linum perenne]